jgi:UDP:flavonoid glycosyltransferase YjiC (YdhE family)
MDKQFKIAFVPLDGFGHVNACIGLAQALKERGHKCVFVVNQTWKGKISSYGFDEEIFIEKHKLGKEASQQWNEFMIDFGDSLQLSPFEKIRAFEAPGWEPMINDVKCTEPLIKDIINKVKPNAIVNDSFVTIPSIVSAGVPWIDLISCNQLFYMNDERLPPGGSGLCFNFIN